VFYAADIVSRVDPGRALLNILADVLTGCVQRERERERETIDVVNSEKKDEDRSN